MFSLEQTISKFIDHYLTARGDKESTLRWYRVRLRQFRLWLEERRRNTLPRNLEDGEGHGSIQPRLLEDEEMFKAFYNYLGVRQHIQHNAARCLKKKRDDDRVPRAISSQVRKDLLDTAFKREDRYAKRNYALLLFLADSGARAGEACSMTLDNLDMDRCETIVTGKHGRRLVVFSAEARTAIEEYLDQRGDILARLIALGLVEPGEPESRHVWLGHQGPLTYWGVRMMLKGIVRETREKVDRETLDRIDNSPTNAHAFRHAFAKDVLYTGGNLAEVRDHLGHKDIKTTEIYACWAVGERHRLHEEHTVVAEEARRRRERAAG
ncbi:MAG: tyrosine-type recombinase/integrase [Planctomycetota bacterium]|jgi:site-specific recombinase XerD